MNNSVSTIGLATPSNSHVREHSKTLEPVTLSTGIEIPRGVFPRSYFLNEPIQLITIERMYAVEVDEYPGVFPDHWRSPAGRIESRFHYFHFVPVSLVHALTTMQLDYYLSRFEAIFSMSVGTQIETYDLNEELKPINGGCRTKDLLAFMQWDLIEFESYTDHYRGLDADFLVCVELNPGPPKTESPTQSLSGSGKQQKRSKKNNNTGVAKLHEAYMDLQDKVKGNEIALKELQMAAERKRDKSPMNLFTEVLDFEIADVTNNMTEYNLRMKMVAYCDTMEKLGFRCLDEFVSLCGANTPKPVKRLLSELKRILLIEIPGFVKHVRQHRSVLLDWSKTVYSDPDWDFLSVLLSIYAKTDSSMSDRVHLFPKLSYTGKGALTLLKALSAKIFSIVGKILKKMFMRWMVKANHLQTFATIISTTLDFLNPFSWYDSWVKDKGHLESALCLRLRPFDREELDTRPYDRTCDTLPREQLLEGQYFVRTDYLDSHGNQVRVEILEAYVTNLQFLGMYPHVPRPQRLKKITISQILLSDCITYRNNRTLAPNDQKSRLRSSYNVTGANTYLDLVMTGNDLMFDQFEMSTMFLRNDAVPVSTEDPLVK